MQKVTALFLQPRVYVSFGRFSSSGWFLLFQGDRARLLRGAGGGGRREDGGRDEYQGN